MRDLKDFFKRRKIDDKKLVKYGFSKVNETYYYEKEILEGSFIVKVEFSDDKKASKVVEKDLNEEYALVDVEDAVGEFVEKVRFEYEKILKDILTNCTESELFKEKQTKRALKFIKEKYEDEFEFPWDKYDTNMIVRNKLSKKWYALFMIIPKSKLGIESDKDAEVVNLHTKPETSELIVDNTTIFPGYHMNKKSWITVILNDGISDEELFVLIDNSYLLSGGSKKIDKLAIKTYEYLRTIPKGKVVTYGQIAKYLGNRGLSRIVGTILHNNPDGEKNPCYKVVNGKGELAECFVFGGIHYQKVLLEKDGIEVKNNKVDLKKYQWDEK